MKTLCKVIRAALLGGMLALGSGLALATPPAPDEAYTGGGDGTAATAQATARAVAQAVADSGGDARSQSAAYAAALAEAETHGRKHGRAHAEAAAHAVAEAVARNGGSARAQAAAYARALAAFEGRHLVPGQPPRHGPPDSAAPSEQRVLVIRGTIRYIPLEGGFYGIVADNGRKYDPVNLPARYRQDGLRVRVVARPVQLFTTRMWGQTVEIVSISRIRR